MKNTLSKLLSAGFVSPNYMAEFLDELYSNISIAGEYEVTTGTSSNAVEMVKHHIIDLFDISDNQTVNTISFEGLKNIKTDDKLSWSINALTCDIIIELHYINETESLRSAMHSIVKNAEYEELRAMNVAFESHNNDTPPFAHLLDN